MQCCLREIYQRQQLILMERQSVFCRNWQDSGENLICDSVRQYFCGEREVHLFYQTSFYDTDRQRKWLTGLSGCVLK